MGIDQRNCRLCHFLRQPAWPPHEANQHCSGEDQRHNESRL